MLNDAYEDFMPRNAPKPTPPIEGAVVPSVPEVSLLFDVDKSKTSGSGSVSKPHRATDKSEDIGNGGPVRPRGDLEPGLLQRNQFESYNTWKARNAQVLQNIAGSAGQIESQLKSARPHVNGLNSKKQRPTVSCNRETVRQAEQSQVETCSQRCGTRLHLEQCQTESVPQTCEAEEVQEERCQMETAPQRQVERRRAEGVPQRYDPHVLQNFIDSAGSVETHFKPSKSDVNERYSKNPWSPDQLDREVRRRIEEYHAEMEMIAARYQPARLEARASKLPDTDCSDPPRQAESENKRGCEAHVCCPPRQPQPPACACQHATGPTVATVNNQQIMDLYNIIHLQNEQILLLQQQVKQVLQVHLNCNTLAKPQCDCPCKTVKDANNTAADKTSVNTQTTLGRGDKVIVPKSNTLAIRSIGVMTSLEEADVGRTARNHRSHGLAQVADAKRRPKVAQVRQVLTRAQRTSSTPARAGMGVTREGAVEEPQSVDDSFSLDEARLVRGLRPPAEEHSPDTSVHVDLHDYCSSCDSASDSYGSDESDEDGAEAGRGSSEPSEPQLGWTFYNQVVGQVNNILKKPGRRGGSGGRRQEWGGADSCEDINWSKRVTFNGDSPGAKINYNRPHVTGGPGQGGGGGGEGGGGPAAAADHLMMYNTNLSFSTLRYLQRYDLLPERLRKAYNGKSSKQTSKSHRRSGKSRHNPDTTSTKLLDVTALKRQPKLF